MTLRDDMLIQALKPAAVQNDRLSTRQHSLKHLIELAVYLDSVDAVSASATQIDGETAVMAGVRTNVLSPGGTG